MTFAEQQLRHATRQQRECVLFFVDLDKMKHINDTFGHQAGDQALLDVAQLLRDTFIAKLLVQADAAMYAQKCRKGR